MKQNKKNITFRVLSKEYYDLVAQWLDQPHVKKWWHDGLPTAEFVEQEYASDPKTLVFMALCDGQPLGMVQSYWVDDYPEHAESVAMSGAVGIDLFIGEPQLIGKGYGTRLLKDYVTEIIPAKYPGAKGVVADPEVTNGASIRAFEKAGFKKGAIVSGEDGPEQIMVQEF